MAAFDQTDRAYDDKAYEERRQLKRQRVMKFFMDALLDINKEEGEDNVTIKNVAERAGYNSATLYNYFKNLDQLVCFSYLSLVENYLADMDRIMKQEWDALTKYVSIWQNYCLHSFANPTAFVRVYMSDDYGKIFSSFSEYREVFPESFKTSSEVFPNALPVTTVNMHDQILFRPVVEQGFVREEEAQRIILFGKLVHAGIIHVAMRNGDNDAEKNTKLFMSYLLEYIEDKLIIKRNLTAEFEIGE